MDLFEYQGKQYFARFGIPISKGGVADTVDEAVAQADQAGYPVVVKAQVQVGGRGKAGGVKLADDAAEVRLHAGNILGLDIKGHVVKRLWVEHASDIAEEYYASFTLDRSAKKHLGMLSAQSRLTTWPLMSRPRMLPACRRTSAASEANLTPPALPRPPTCTCALTTTG